MSKRVLIIDDAPAIRRNLTFGLTQEGYACTACPDGISAIHELSGALDKGEVYDYLITDILSDNDARTPAFGPRSPLNIGRPAAAKTGFSTALLVLLR